jgi:hypothetical protein
MINHNDVMIRPALSAAKGCRICPADRKLEFFNGWPADVGQFGRMADRFRSLERFSAFKKPAIGGPFSQLTEEFSQTHTCWLEREESNSPIPDPTSLH